MYTPKTVPELCLYLYIYKLLIDHDRKMKLVLQPTAISKRVQKNVISLSGHAINFTVETVWSLTFMIIVLQGMPKDQDQLFMFHLFEQNIYGVLSLLHMMLSQPLRSDCSELKNSICKIFYNIFPSQICLKLIVLLSNVANHIINM